MGPPVKIGATGQVLHSRHFVIKMRQKILNCSSFMVLYCSFYRFLIHHFIDPKKIPENSLTFSCSTVVSPLNKKHISYIDRFIRIGFSMCKSFLDNNKEILVTRADKGQTTV